MGVYHKALMMMTDPLARHAWRSAYRHGLLAAGFVLAWMAYWFGVANRYTIFLYFHDMGPLVPDTTPFSRTTVGRYWMTGLVAAGLLLGYTAVIFAIGRLRERYVPPAKWQVWSVAAVVLLIGIPAITMTLNDPTLPIAVALQVTAVALVGVALAIQPGPLAARDPRQLAWIAADGAGAGILLTILPQLENAGAWRARGADVLFVLVLVIVTSSLGWLALLTGLHIWRRTVVPTAAALFVAGLCWATLVLPAVHFLLGTDLQFYITTTSNFFATTWTWQLATWGLVWLLCAAVTAFRRQVTRSA